MVIQNNLRNDSKRSKSTSKEFYLLSGVTFSTHLQPEVLNEFIFTNSLPFDKYNFTIYQELTRTCHDLAYFPKSKSLVLTTDSFSYLINQKDQFLANISDRLNIEPSEAADRVAHFFTENRMLVQQKGIQGLLFNVGTFAQTAGSASMVSRTIIIAKGAGVTGLQILRAQPLMLVTIPTVGAIFFHGCASVIGDNVVGRACGTVGNVLNLPMYCTELMYNTYLAPVVNRVTGIPTLLNYTKQISRGPGLDALEAFKLLKDGEKISVLQTIKCYLIQKLGGKC